jgi:hypothetical protein
VINKGLDVWQIFTVGGGFAGDWEKIMDMHEMGTIFCWEISDLQM